MFDCEPMRRSKLPEAYLDLRNGADTRAHRERRVRGFVGGPFKLYRVQGTDEKLVAVVGPTFDSEMAAFPPLIYSGIGTLSGPGFYAPLQNESGLIKQNIEAFLFEALTRKQAK